MWTRFMDMHSGGSRKESWEYLYIELPLSKARGCFSLLFGHDPDNVTCNCCGEDYVYYEYETLEEATKFERGDKSVENWCSSDDVLVISADEVKLPSFDREPDVRPARKVTILP